MIPDYFPTDHRDYIREELSLRQQRRPQYSLRAFARDLSMSASSLCEFLAGRQGLSQKRVLNIAGRLGLGIEQQQHFWDLIESRFARQEAERRAAKIRALRRSQESNNHLTREKFHLISDWYYLTLVEILSLPNLYLSYSDLCHILNISSTELKVALTRLEKLGLVEEVSSPTGLFHRAKSEVTLAGDSGPDEAVRLCHQQMLAMQSLAVEKKPIQERESLSVAFKVSQKEWPHIRAEMKRAIISVASRFGLELEANDQVICMSMQMITLLSPEKESNSEKVG